MITLNPYLVFKDSCEAAFNFYKLVFHSDNLYIARYQDVPETAKQFFPMSEDAKVMHATLQINTQTSLMGCDNLKTYEQSTTGFVNNFYLYISIDSNEEARRIFDELSAEGQVIMPISQTFWSSYYGMLTDKFGIHWKITCNPNDQ
jgi:PhnB protein